MQSISDMGFIREIATLPYVNEIYLFGSRARGENAPRADIDIAVSCPEAGECEWLKVIDIVESADTLLPVDCVKLEEVAEKLKNNILRDGVIIYSRSKK